MSSFSDYAERLSMSGYEVEIVSPASHKAKIRVRVKLDNDVVARRKALFKRAGELLIRHLSRSF